jgi:hypothetical protein
MIRLLLVCVAVSWGCINDGPVARSKPSDPKAHAPKAALPTAPSQSDAGGPTDEEAIAAASRAAVRTSGALSYHVATLVLARDTDPCGTARASREPNSKTTRAIAIVSGERCAAQPRLRGRSVAQILREFGGDSDLATGDAVESYTYHLGRAPRLFHPVRLHFCFVKGRIAEVHLNAKHPDLHCDAGGRRLTMGPEDDSPRELRKRGKPVEILR